MAILGLLGFEAINRRRLLRSFVLLFVLFGFIFSTLYSQISYAQGITVSDLNAILEKHPNYDPNATDCQNVTPALQTVTTNKSVYVIGDSYLRDSATLLTTSLKASGYETVTINGHGGRGINRPANDGAPAALTAIEQDKDKIASAGTIIIILGTNPSDAATPPGPINAYDSSIPVFMKKLTGYNAQARIFWVNTDHLDTQRTVLIKPTNTAIEKYSSQFSYKVVDWYSALEKTTKKQYLDPSSSYLHPNTTKGYPLFVDTIKASVGSPITSYQDSSNAPSVASNSVNLKLLTDVQEKNKPNVPIIWNWLRAKGFSEVQTAGIMGNIYQESKFQIDLWDPPAYGLIQWQHERLDQLKKFASNRNIPLDNIDTQMRFMMTELTSKTGRFYEPVYLPLKKTTDLATAVNLMLEHYEEPGDYETERPLRLKWAKEVLETMGGSAVSTPTPAPTDGKTNCAPVTGNSCESILLPTIIDPSKLGSAIDKYISDVSKSYNGKKSPFDGLGSKFVEGGIKSGINPFIAVVHAHKESLFALYDAKGWHNYTFATKEAAAAGNTAQLSPSYNAYGRSAGGDQPTVWYNGSNGPRPVYKWSSWENSLTGDDSFFAYYKRKWVDEKKYTSIDDIIKEYAPASDGNNPSEYASFMHNNISKLISLAGDSIDCGSGGAGAGGSGGTKLDGKETVKLQYGYYVKDGGDPKMIYYSQYDARYNGAEGKKIYPSYDRTDLGPFGQCGCFSTSMAMAINTIGANKNINPLDIGKEVLAAGVNAGGCGYSGESGFGEKLGPKFNVSIKSTNSFTVAKQGLRDGGLVVLSVGPSEFTTGSHYIVLRGLTSDGKFAVANPTNKDQTLTGTYTESHISSIFNGSGKMWVVSAK
ncbi:MAG: phage tail tip lysozyme [Candidatus Saccharimonadales bacterium]